MQKWQPTNSENCQFSNYQKNREKGWRQSPEDGSPVLNSGPPDYGWSGVFSELNLEIFWYLCIQNFWFSLCVNIVEICL